MKGGKWALGLAVLLAVKGTGVLPRGRGVEERKLVTALAVDGGERVGLTAVTGVRASEEEEPEVLMGTGESLAAACRELRGGSARRVYLGQTEQLLVGDGRGLKEILDFVVTDRELRLDTLLYIVKGDAGEALAASAGLTAEETGGRDPRGRTVGEILPRLAEGEYTLVPALAAGTDGLLKPAGWAVLGPKGLAGYLEETAALGADLLSGMDGERVVTFPHGAVELTSVRSWAVDGALRCALTARVVEGDPEPEELASWGKIVLEAALASGWDCWGLERELGALRPGDWEKWENYPVKELAVKVTGKLVRS